MEGRVLRKRSRLSPTKTARQELDFSPEESQPKKRRTSERRLLNIQQEETQSSGSDNDSQTFTIKSFYGGKDNMQYPHSPSRRKAVLKVLDKYCDQENTVVVNKKYPPKRSRSQDYVFRTSSSDETEPEWQPRVALKGLPISGNKPRQKVKLNVKKIPPKTMYSSNNRAIKGDSGMTKKDLVEKLNDTSFTDSTMTPIVSGKKFFKTRSPASADRGSVLVKKGFKLQFVARRLSIPKTPNSDSKVYARGKKSSSRTKYVPSVSVASFKGTGHNKLRLVSSEISKDSLDISSCLSSSGSNFGDNLSAKETPDTVKIAIASEKVKDDGTVDSAIDTAHSEDLFSSEEFYTDQIQTCNKESEMTNNCSLADTDEDENTNCKGLTPSETGRSTPLSYTTKPTVSSPSTPSSLGSLQSGQGTGSPSGPKLFPIFTSARVTPPSSGNKISRRSSPAGISLRKLKKSKDGMEQMIIDAGQKKYGMAQCDRCNMVYSHDSQEDAALHEKFHQRVVQCLKFPGWKTERCVQEYGDGSRVIMVSSDDYAYKLKKVEEVNSLMSEELGFSEVPFSKRLFYKAFLSISHNKMIEGCCLTEEVTEGYPVLPDSPGSSEHSQGSVNHPANRPWYCSDSPRPASIGISRIWVHSSCRKTGVASKLLDCARHWAIYGMVIPRNKVAFSDPTPDGRILATKYTGNPGFLVYKYRDV